MGKRGGAFEETRSRRLQTPLGGTRGAVGRLYTMRRRTKDRRCQKSRRSLASKIKKLLKDVLWIN